MTQSNTTFPPIHVHNHLPGSSARIDTHYGTPETPPPAPPTPPQTMVKRSASTCTQPVIDLTNSDSDVDLAHSDSDVDLADPDNNIKYEGEDLDDIRYPRILGMLAELEREFPDLNFGQYQGVLIANGFMYVSQLVDEPVRQQLGGLGINIGVINLLLSRAERVMRRTQKSTIKQED